MGQSVTPGTAVVALEEHKTNAIAPYRDHPIEDLTAPLLPSVRNRMSRARELRAHADAMPGPAAAAFRRRASELELEAFLLQTKFDHMAHTPLRATS